MTKGEAKQIVLSGSTSVDPQKIAAVLHNKTPKKKNTTNVTKELPAPVSFDLLNDEKYVKEDIFNDFKNSIEHDVQNFKVQIEEFKKSLVLNDEAKNKSVEQLREEIEKLEKSLANFDIHGLKQKFSTHVEIFNFTKKLVDELSSRVIQVDNDTGSLSKKIENVSDALSQNDKKATEQNIQHQQKITDLANEYNQKITTLDAQHKEEIAKLQTQTESNTEKINKFKSENLFASIIKIVTGVVVGAFSLGIFLPLGLKITNKISSMVPEKFFADDDHISEQKINSSTVKLSGDTEFAHDDTNFVGEGE